MTRLCSFIDSALIRTESGLESNEKCPTCKPLDKCYRQVKNIFVTFLETQAAQRIAEVQQAVKEMDTNSNTITAPVTPKTDKMAQPIEDYLLESGKKLMERKEQLRLDHLEKLVR